MSRFAPDGPLLPISDREAAVLLVLVERKLTDAERHDLASLFGVTVPRIQQIESRLLNRLRRHVAPRHPVFSNNSELSLHIRQLSARAPTATCAVVTACQWPPELDAHRTAELLASKRA